MKNIGELEKKIGYSFRSKDLIERALTHSSFNREKNTRHKDNERLEFLGDAFLDAIVGAELYSRMDAVTEGTLTKTRALIVCEKALAKVSREFNIGKYMLMGHGEAATGGRNKDSILADALEALIGAIYLDQGYRMCYHFVEDVIINKYIDLDNIARKEVNFKSSLIEWSQKNKLEITFELIESFTDNDGNPVFQTGVTLADTQIGVGIGYSKKESQQNAAKMAIKKLRTDKVFQQFISELKKKQTGETTAEHEFEDLPEEDSATEQEQAPVKQVTNNNPQCIDATINEEVR